MPCLNLDGMQLRMWTGRLDKYGYDCIVEVGYIVMVAKRQWASNFHVAHHSWQAHQTVSRLIPYEAEQQNQLGIGKSVCLLGSAHVASKPLHWLLLLLLESELITWSLA